MTASARSARTTVRRRVDPLEHRREGDAEGVAEPGRADDDAEQQLRAGQSPIGFSRSRNAMNMVRKPDSHRGPQLARSANATVPGMRIRGRPPARPGRADAATACVLAGVGVDPCGQPDRPDRRQHEQHERVAQRPLRPEDGRQPGDRRRDARADDAGQRDPAVGLDQGEALREQAGYGGRAGDAVRLGRHQAAERGGNSHVDSVIDRAGQAPDQEGADRHRRADRPAAAVAEPVEERAEQRRDDRERQHRQAEEQRDLAAGLAGRDLEEQRAGQRDRHRGVAGGVEGVHLDQPRAGPTRRRPRRSDARRAWRRVNRLARPAPRGHAATAAPVPRAPVPSARPTFRRASARPVGARPARLDVVMRLSCRAGPDAGAANRRQARRPI